MSTKLPNDFLNVVNDKNKCTLELQNSTKSEIPTENKLKLESSSTINDKKEVKKENTIKNLSENINVQSCKNSDTIPQSKKLPHRSLSNELLPSLQALNLASQCENDACTCRKTNKRHGSVLQYETPIIKLSRNDIPNSSPKLSTLNLFKTKTKLPDFSSFLPNDIDCTKAFTLPKDYFTTADSRVRITDSSEVDDISECKLKLAGVLDSKIQNRDKSNDGIVDLSDIVKALPTNNVTQSCSQQALSKPSMDDCSISELSAYFENYCHIPKNMSDMAKMMYA